MSASNYLENKILDHVLRYGDGSLTPGTGAGYEPPATLYLALFTSNTGLESGTLTNEVSATGTNYARRPISFNAASNGTAQSNGAISFATATADYGDPVTSIAIMDDSTYGAGNMLFYGDLTTPKVVNSGDTFQVADLAIQVSLD